MPLGHSEKVHLCGDDFLFNRFDRLELVVAQVAAPFVFDGYGELVDLQARVLHRLSPFRDVGIDKFREIA